MTLRSISTLLVMIAMLSCVATVSAEVRLPAIFGNHMVLQRNQPLPVWGRAAPGERITVTLANQTQRTTADSAGKCLVRFAPRPASSQPLTLTVAASNTIILTDILIGEVWLCSGQSNMHWPLRKAANGEAEAASANLPKLRLLNLRGNPYPDNREFDEQELATSAPEKYLTGKWDVSTPETAADFSAVAYYFGRELLTKLNVPVGLIHNAIGGTPIEAWISRDSLNADPSLRPMFDNWFANELIHSFCRERAGVNLRRLMNEKTTASPQLRHPYQPGFMYEAGIAPLAPYAMRGVIWYQGESNAHNASLHDKLFPLLIAEWRRLWKQGDFPFLYVQLPNMGTEKGYAAERWPEFRASQARSLRIPNTGMAVTIDIGDPADVHPRNKREVGHRLALRARARVYGEKIEYSGPMLKAVSRESHGLRLRFNHAAGLTARGGGELRGFELSDKNGVHPATARIAGRTVIISSPTASEPAEVRYAWRPNPDCNLVNGAGLSASPFRTTLTAPVSH